MSKQHNWRVAPEVVQWIHDQFTLTAINDRECYSAVQKNPKLAEAWIAKMMAREMRCARDDPFSHQYTLSEAQAIVFVQLCDYYGLWQNSSTYDGKLARYTETPKVEAYSDTRASVRKVEVSFQAHGVILAAVVRPVLKLIDTAEPWQRAVDHGNHDELFGLVRSFIVRNLNPIPEALRGLTSIQTAQIALLYILDDINHSDCQYDVFHDAFKRYSEHYGPMRVDHTAVSAAQETQTTEQEKQGMNANHIDYKSNSAATNAPAFETRHFVNGRDVTGMRDDELINAIKALEGEIADLKSVKTKSKAITAKITSLEEMLAKTVEVLDARA